MMSTMNELVPEYANPRFAVDTWIAELTDGAKWSGVTEHLLPPGEWPAFIKGFVDTIRADVNRRIGPVYQLRWEADGSWYTEAGNDILPPLEILFDHFQDCAMKAVKQVMDSSEFFRLMRLCHEVKDLSGMPLEEMV